jgi:hypothetical protein
MKAITLLQPFASLIAVEAKTMVTRPEATAFRGPLAIHAASTPVTVRDPYHRSVLMESGVNPNNLPFGAVIAQCRLVDCRKITANNCPCYPEYAFSDFKAGWFAWMLSEIRVLPEPVPTQGGGDLWQWHP